MKNKCDCYSYNFEVGNTPTVLVQHEKSGTKSIDFCIAHVIKHLWDNNVWTIGSCCGHNFMRPSIILGEGEDNYSEIRDLIKEVDDRNFELSQWKRVFV